MANYPLEKETVLFSRTPGALNIAFVGVNYHNYHWPIPSHVAEKQIVILIILMTSSDIRLQ